MTDTAMPDTSPPDEDPAPPPAGWERFLFDPESTAAATLMRIGFGAVSALWALSLLPDVDPLLTTGELRYELNRVPGTWNLLNLFDFRAAPLIACLLMAVASLATMVGYRTRVSAVFTALCMISLQRTAPLVFNSGDLLLRQVAVVVALAPCGLLWSVDARRNRKRGDTGPPRPRAPWALRLLQLQLATGYLLSAWAKARGTTWHDGTAVARAMRIVDVQRFAPPEWLLEQSDVLNLLTWGTLAFEAAFLFLVWNRRLRPWVLGAGVALHLGIDTFFDVGFFTPALLLCYVAFLPPETAERALAWLQEHLGSYGRRLFSRSSQPSNTATARGS